MYEDMQHTLTVSDEFDAFLAANRTDLVTSQAEYVFENILDEFEINDQPHAFGDTGEFFIFSKTDDQFVSMSPHLGTFIVIARQDHDYSGRGTFFDLQFNVSGASIGYFEPSTAGGTVGSDSDVHQIEIKVTGDITESQRATAEELAKVIAELDVAIDNLSDQSLISLPNGQAISGTQLKALWATMDFTLTDKSYGTNRSGAAHPDGNVEVNINDLSTYFNNFGADGLEYYILHELAHITGPDQIYNDQSWADYREVAPDNRESPNHYAQTGFFRGNEAFGNSLARLIGTHLNVSWSFTPTFNYQNW